MVRKILKLEAGIFAAVMVLTALLAPTPVFAAEEVASLAPSCRMYEDALELDALNKRESVLRDEFLRSASMLAGDHCEMANIHYQLARKLPGEASNHLNACIDHSQRAITRDPRAGVAYFFKGLCLGRLGEMKGIWGSLNIIKPFRQNMEAAIKIDPAIDRGGPHRALGRLYYKLPLILGGDIKKSVRHLEKAIQYGPEYWENHFFLAESYLEDRQYQRARDELQRAMEISAQLKGDPDSPARNVEFQGLMSAIENHTH